MRGRIWIPQSLSFRHTRLYATWIRLGYALPNFDEPITGFVTP